MASEEMKATAEAIRAAGVLGGDPNDIQAMRASMEAGASTVPVPDDIQHGDFDAGGISSRHVAAPDVRNDRGVLYFHGGGYVLGSLNTHTELMGRISRVCRAPVLGIDYRLAPENPYPAAVEDAVASYERLRQNGITAEQIVIAGDSAGGGLALACMLALKEQNIPLPAGAVLFSPWTDLTGSGESVNSRAALDPMVSPELLSPMAQMYLNGADPSEAGASPLFGDLSGLPPLLVQVGDHEILLDDSLRLAERAKTVGVDVTLQVFDGAFHVFQNQPHLPESAEALAAVADFFDRVTG